MAQPNGTADRGAAIAPPLASGNAGDDPGATGAIDPASLTGTPAGSGDRGGKSRGGWPRGKPRGRNPGTGTGTASPKVATALDLSAAAGILVGFHAILATKAPEWAMEPEEAAAITKAAANVLRHYDIRTTQKALDWGAFAVVVGQSYF